MSMKEIVEYNETDAVTTHLLMLRVGLHAGQLDPERYAAEVEAVGRLVAEQAATGKGQMAKFAEAWRAGGDGRHTVCPGGVSVTSLIFMGLL